MVKLRISTIGWVVIAGILIFGVSGLVLWQNTRTKPANVFDRMLTTMLTTPSVTKKITQEENGQKLEQTVQLTTSPSAQVHSKNVLNQGQAVITTESIGNKQNDFIRYLVIATDQKNSAGQAFDFSQVLKIWGKSGDDKNAADPAQLFNQTILGAVPVADLTPQGRQKVQDQIKHDNVYEVNYATVKKNTINKRPTYTYEVSVQPVAYINMLKTFASTMGIDSLEKVDASIYADTPALKFSFEVDVWSGQLGKVTYVDSNRTEKYSAYGARVLIQLPKDAVSLDELQSRLQKIQ